MSTKTIPARIIKTCDCCQKEITTANSRQDGGLHIKAAALDFSGAAVADASRKLDLCDACLGHVCTAIDAAIQARAAASIGAKGDANG